MAILGISNGCILDKYGGLNNQRQNKETVCRHNIRGKYMTMNDDADDDNDVATKIGVHMHDDEKVKGNR